MFLVLDLRMLRKPYEVKCANGCVMRGESHWRARGPAITVHRLWQWAAWCAARQQATLHCTAASNVIPTQQNGTATSLPASRWKWPDVHLEGFGGARSSTDEGASARHYRLRARRWRRLAAQLRPNGPIQNVTRSTAPGRMAMRKWVLRSCCRPRERVPVGKTVGSRPAPAAAKSVMNGVFR